MTKRIVKRATRGRPPKKLTGAELMRRYKHKTLVWCDENGEPTIDQTKPAVHVRALSKKEAKMWGEIAWIDELMSECPEFERCTADGTPDPNGNHWKLRDGAVA